MKKIIKLTESELKNIIKEAVVKTVNEARNANYNYKNADQRFKVAQHFNNKTRDEKRQEWEDIIAKRTAITDINRDRDWKNLPQHEKDFTRETKADTFNIDFEDFYNFDYDDTPIGTPSIYRESVGKK